MRNLSSISSKTISIVIAYFLIYVVWGSTYYFIGVALKDFPVFLLGALRFSVAGMILLIVCYLRKENIFRKSLILKSAISGIVLLFIDMAVVMLAQHYVSSSLVAIIASSTAIWIMVFDIPMWKSNFCQLKIVLGIIVGFGGVAMLYAEQLYTITYQNHQYGILLLIGGCISWALGTLYTKYRSSHEENQNSFSGSAWQMLFASVMFGICSLFSNDLSHIHFDKIEVSSWLSLLYLITCGSILAYSAYVWLLKIRPATEVATHAYVNPFIAVVLGVFLGKENVSWIQIIGLIIILFGVILISRKYTKRESYSR